MKTQEEMQQSVNSYLQGKQTHSRTFKFLTSTMSEIQQAIQLAAEMIDFLAEQGIADRIRILADLSQNLQHSGADENINRRRKILKDALAGVEKENWKNYLLKTQIKQIFSLFYTPLKYDNSAKREVLLLGDRFAVQEAGDQNAAVMGSSFITSKSVMQHGNESHVLDAIYSARKVTDNKELIVALADGCGGHCRVTPTYFGDPALSLEEKKKLVTQTNKDFELQDKNISRATHFATKHAVRLLASYRRPEDLYNNILFVIKQVEQEIKRKAPNEATTLVCARAFATGKGYRVIGFGIGDSMLAGWNPTNMVFITLIPSAISMPHETQEATAQIPDQYHDFEVHMIDKLVPPGTIILPLSDGYVDYLPQVVHRKQYPNGLEYKEVILDSTDMQEMLTTEATPRDYLIRLSNFVLSKVNEQCRQELQDPERSQEIQLGDDMAGAALVLPREMKIVTLEEQLSAAIKKGDVIEVKELLQDPNLDIYTTYHNRDTVLHVACTGPFGLGKIGPEDFKCKSSPDYQQWTKKYLKIIELLLNRVPICERSNFVNARNNFQETPLHHAVERSRNEEIVSYLLDNDADLYLGNDKEETVLHLAVARQDNTLPLVDLLLLRDRYGKLVNEEDETGNRPLHLVCEKKRYPNYQKIVELLTDEGTELEAVNDANESPITCAIKGEDFKVFKYLFSKTKSSINYRDFAGKTLLHHALEYIKYMKEKHSTTGKKLDCRQQIKLVESLLERGADPDIPDYELVTPRTKCKGLGEEQLDKIFAKYHVKEYRLSGMGQTLEEKKELVKECTQIITVSGAFEDKYRILSWYMFVLNHERFSLYKRYPGCLSYNTLYNRYHDIYEPLDDPTAPPKKIDQEILLKDVKVARKEQTWVRAQQLKVQQLMTIYQDSGDSMKRLINKADLDKFSRSLDAHGGFFEQVQKLACDTRRLPYLIKYVGQYYRANKTVLISDVKKASSTRTTPLMSAVGHFGSRTTANLQAGVSTQTETQIDDRRYTF
jgi:ankyrin repeat protein